MVSFEECISKLSRMASHSIFITQIGEKEVPHPYKFMFTWNFALRRGEDKLKKVTIWCCCLLSSEIENIEKHYHLDVYPPITPIPETM